MSNNRPIFSAFDVTDIVRDVVGHLAPEELDVVDQVGEAWREGELNNRRPKGSPGRGVGFGVEELLLTQLLYPIVAAAIGEVLGTVVLEPDRLPWKRRRTQPKRDELVARDASSPAGFSPPLQLSQEQAEKLRASCQSHARALGLPAAKAKLLADAILGSLSRRQGD